MKIFNRNQAELFLRIEIDDDYYKQLGSQLSLVRGAYSIPPEAGRQTAFAKLLSFLLTNESATCVDITGWGIATEHLDLFYGYRRAFGEIRPLIESAVHVFEPQEHDEFISVLCVVMYFFWDAWVFSIDRQWLLRVSHDGWFEIYTRDVEFGNIIATSIEEFKIHLLAENR